MKIKSKVLLSALVAATTLSASWTALAVPPHMPDLVKDGNRWLITFYNDSSAKHNRWATQGLCFFRVATVGTHTRYVWYSDTFPNWNGWATQEGDQIFMHGDYARNQGHDGMEWEIVTNSPRNEGAGHWKEWRENIGFGRTIGFGNAKFVRVGKCRHHRTVSVVEAEMEKEVKIYSDQYADIEFSKSVDGRDIVTPSGVGFKNKVADLLEAR